MAKKIILLFALASLVMFSACTQETQNKIGRGLQNWTGTNGNIFYNNPQ